MLAYTGSPSSFTTATRNICPIFQLTLNSEQPASVSCIHFGKAEMAQQSCRHCTSPTTFYTCASCILTSMSLPASLALMPKYEGFRSSLGCWVYLQALLQKSWKQPQYLKNNHVCTIKKALNYPVHHTCHRIRLKFVGMYPLQEVYPGVHLPQDMPTFVPYPSQNISRYTCHRICPTFACRYDAWYYLYWLAHFGSEPSYHSLRVGKTPLFGLCTNQFIITQNSMK